MQRINRIWWWIVGVSLIIACSGEHPERAGIEVGNPMVSVNTRFQMAEGFPQPIELARRVGKTPEDVFWDDFHLVLREVRYFGSYYYYLPIDPSEGTLLWPEYGSGTTMRVDVLNGDSLRVNFKNINIPNRSYLKEVEVFFDLSGVRLHGEFEGKSLEINFPDSVFLRLRYHHTQLTDATDLSESDSVHYDLRVLFHPQAWLAAVNFSGLSRDSGGVVRIDEDNHAEIFQEMLAAFPRSFNAARYRFQRGSQSSVWEIAPAALTTLDSSGAERVVNGNFARRGESWVLSVLDGGVADTSFANGAARIQISNPGSVDYSVQWMQEDIELIHGRRYVLRFEAWSDQPGTLMIARVGRYYSPYDNLDSAGRYLRINLSNTPQVWTLSILAKETTPFGRLEFNLGKWGPRVVWIRGVSLTQE